MTTQWPVAPFIADHTTPSLAASAVSPSGITKWREPFDVPGGKVSLGWRSNMRSTPPWRGRPGRGESNPSEMTGARPCQRGTGQTHPSPDDLAGATSNVVADV